MKKVVRFLCRFLLVFFTFIVFLFATIYACCFLITHGPSETAKDLFTTTMLETGQMKFMASWFLSDEEIKKIVNKNSLTVMKDDVNSDLVEVNSSVSDEIIVEEVSGDNYTGTMLIIKDPSKVFVGTTYPWGEYGKVLDEIVKKYDAIAGVNGGLYVSTANKGGHPIGIVVSEGKITY